MKTIIKSSILSLLLGLFASITFAQEKETEYEVGYKEKGKASYYGEKLHGKLTANGEKYDMFSMTAAHPSIPFNSIIKVTNLNAPDKWVTLRINDRGPFTKSRILDISKKAALKLNMEKTGVLEVELEILKLGDNESLASNKADSAKIEVANAKKAEEKKVNDKKENVVASSKDESAKAVSKANEKTIAKSDKSSKKTVETAKTENAVANLPLNQRFKDTGTYNIWGTPVKPKGYGLQLGAYSEIDQAIKVANEANNLGLKGLYIQSGWSNQQTSYRVLYGAWPDQDKAKENIVIAKKKGFPAAFVKNHF